MNRTIEHCRRVFSGLPGVSVHDEACSPRGPNRFSASPVLRHLADHWASPRPFAPSDRDDGNHPKSATSLPEALRFASWNPANFIGVGHMLGQLAPGYRADMVAIDPESLGVLGTWVAGAHRS